MLRAVRSPDEIRLLLLHIAAESARDPVDRARAASWFRAALTLVDDSRLPGDGAGADGRSARAVAELVQLLHRGREVVEYLAEGIN